MKYLGYLVIAVILLLCSVACDGLECYSCTSANHTACEDPFPSKRAKAAGFLIQCPEPKEPQYKVLCRKTHQTVRGLERVIRSCGYANHSEACLRTRNAEVVVRSCQCFEDGCNGAGQLTAGGILALALAAAGRAIY